MDYENYPGFFKSVDGASNTFQGKYLLLIRGEYLLLILASVVSLRMFEGATAYLIFAAVLVMAMAALLTRMLSKPEQNWYKCRALAESVKTMSWRYIMRAEPFHEDGALADPRNRFRDHLQELFTHNRQTIEKMEADQSADDQITAEMDRIRSLDLPGRIGYYSAMRVGDQRNWYADKARWNQTRTKRWSITVVLTYV